MSQAPPRPAKAVAERYHARHNNGASVPPQEYHTPRTGARKPLSEISNMCVHTPSSPYHGQKHHTKNGITTSSSPGHLPHNESLTANANGALSIRSSPATSPEHKRVSALVNESGNIRDANKRDSQISQASTNASDAGRGRKRKSHIGHWQLGKTIGKGGCSRVRAVRHKYSGMYGAVKIISRSVAETTRAQSLANLIESSRDGSTVDPYTGGKPMPFGLEREIAVMKLLEHPNIVRLYDVWENRNELYLIMEYVDGGELFHHVESRKGLSELDAVYIFRQIVSALLYCHRMQICHRDLKPENILLDQKTLTVKLIDFGMAALQPEGKFLSTPCGSPHYAAPEVISTKAYDGRKADVWSCGVILYVMLTGTTPYNYSPSGDIKYLFRDIQRARYFMPPELSLEAKDLIQCIFMVNAEKRISMDGVWDHALMHKYNSEFGFTGLAETKEAAVGPTPKLEDWTLRRLHDIDREILRNMRTLWHSEPEQSLIQKLLSKEVNQEKLFYAALLKHREEHMENYEDIGYSASDYHHSRPPTATDAPPVPLSKETRSASAYSILNDEHLRPTNHSFVEPPPSVSSYDPYRSSKTPVVNARGNCVNVTVHRRGSNASSGKRQPANGQILRHPGSLRIETLKQGRRLSRHLSSYSSSSLPHSVHGAQGHSRSSVQRSSASRHSIVSSVWPSSPPVIAKMRPSELHKRGISFGHMRRTSTASALTAQDSVRSGEQQPVPKLPEPPTKAQRALAMAQQHREQHGGPESSPAAPVAGAVRSKKERTLQTPVPQIKVRKQETPSHYIRSEVRKVSTELEKACEEAFFRQPVSSTATAPNGSSCTDKPSSYEAHPSSVDRSERRELAGRRWPVIQKDTPNTYINRTIEEARDKLAAYRFSGGDGERFDEVLGLLDRLMPGTRMDNQRCVSAPIESKAPDHLGFLPMISEEGDNRSSRNVAGNWRSVTSPAPRKDRADYDRTIRVVEPSSPGAVRPLTIRKRSNGSDSERSRAPSSASSRQPSSHASNERLREKRSHGALGTLQAIDEDAAEHSADGKPILKGKKPSWLKRLKNQLEEEPRPSRLSSTPPTSTRPGTSANWRELHDRQGAQTPALDKSRAEKTVLKKVSPEPTQTGSTEEFPIRKPKAEHGKRGFSKWFGWKSGLKEDGTAVTDSSATGTNSLNSLFSTNSQTGSTTHNPSEPERSWFARFLHIRPVTKILCFSVPRGKARAELVILFREWRRHGIKDLTYSRETNIITARVDKQNSLDIKPVTFRIELFVVLEHRRRVGMCIARFVQVKGAASSFRRVLEVVEGVMRGRGWCVEDEEKWRALCEVVDG